MIIIDDGSYDDTIEKCNEFNMQANQTKKFKCIKTLRMVCHQLEIMA